MKEKKIGITFVFLIVILGLVLLFEWWQTETKKETKQDTIDVSKVEDIDITIPIDEKPIDWKNYPTYDIVLTESITIEQEGVYHLMGKIADGNITIDTSSNVKLILDNVEITNSGGPAIYVANASMVVMELLEGTENYLEDGKNYSGEEIGTIYSHDDITFMGLGTLHVISKKEDAIVGKDDVKFLSGTYQILSEDDGIRGKDSIFIQDGTFSITAKGDGLKSTNDKDSEKGFIFIQNGTFTIQAGSDGISSASKMFIQNGTFHIETKNDNLSSSGGKGIKSSGNLVIEEGTFTIQTDGDSIHSKNSIGIKNGTFFLSSKEDGVHADQELIVENGFLKITESYEGLEASKMTITGGNLSIFSFDDGINIASGNEEATPSQKKENLLMITDGTIYVNANGDGIDANGSIYMFDGSVHVDGPTDSKNGAIDYDAIFEMNGGTLLAGGSKEMRKGISDISKSYSMEILFPTSYGKGDTICIQDSAGKEILSYESEKEYSSLIIVSPNFYQGKEYTILINGKEYETITLSKTVNSIGK